MTNSVFVTAFYFIYTRLKFRVKTQENNIGRNGRGKKAMPLTEVQEMKNDLREIAGFVEILAKAVLVKNEGEYDEINPMGDSKPDEYGDNSVDAGYHKMEGGMDDKPYDDPLDKHENGNGYDDMNGEPVDLTPEGEEEIYDDFQAAYKAIKAMRKVGRQAKKGYAAAAQTKRDEHDAPFGDKDSDLKGNEPQPRGAQGGEREDETFGPGGMAYRKMRKDLNSVMTSLKDVAGGVVVAKAIAPSGAANQTPESGEVTQVTREMQEQVKGMTFKQICKFREDIGDLPRFLI